ncbi:MAG: MmcQ/YjbR family DNA-binding protein [Bacteroidales bacterium]|nr:MmcQ/YjbR family DNA-binding protein [Bacteroidales bacterium]
MNIETLRDYCLQKKGVSEGFPFDESTLVFKVGGKMFLLTGLDKEFSINVKCDPEKAIELREKYSCVLPGYHMNKKHWNTIKIDESIPDNLLFKWIDNSYSLVLKSLGKKNVEEILKGEL